MSNKKWRRQAGGDSGRVTSETGDVADPLAGGSLTAEAFNIDPAARQAFGEQAKANKARRAGMSPAAFAAFEDQCREKLKRRMIERAAELPSLGHPFHDFMEAVADIPEIDYHMLKKFKVEMNIPPLSAPAAAPGGPAESAPVAVLAVAANPPVDPPRWIERQPAPKSVPQAPKAGSTPTVVEDTALRDDAVDLGLTPAEFAGPVHRTGMFVQLEVMRMLSDVQRFLWKMVRATMDIVDSVPVGELRRVIMEDAAAPGDVVSDGKLLRAENAPNQPQRKAPRGRRHPLMVLIGHALRACSLLQRSSEGTHPNLHNEPMHREMLASIAAAKKWLSQSLEGKPTPATA